MADENPPHSAPDAGKEPAIEQSALTDTTYTPPPPRRSKRRRNILIVAVVLVVLVGGLFLWRYLSSYESTDDAQVDVHLYPVSARISGYVIAVNVDDNQWVEKGKVLVEIDPKDYQVAAAQARANLANSEATAQSLNITVPITTVNTSSQLSFTSSDIESAKAGIASAVKQLAAAHYQVVQAQATDVKAQDDLQRYKLLVDKKEVADQIYDQALAAARASTAAVAGAEATEAAAKQAVEQANSRLAQAQANYQYAETAPQQVSSTKARARAAIADVEQRRALLEQAELNLQSQLRHMRVGQKAKIHIDSSGRTFDGHVDSLAGATGPLFSLLPPENATGNYVKIVQRLPVKIVLEPGENRDHQLRPGMNVVPDVYLK